MSQDTESNFDTISESVAAQLFNDIEALVVAGDYEAAMEAVATVNKDPQYSTKSARWLAVIAIRTGNLVYAIDLLKEFETAGDATGDAIEVLATLYALVGKVQEALYFGKLATMSKPDGEMYKFLPSNFPTFAFAFNNLRERPLYNDAIGQVGNGDYAAAVIKLEQHLSLFPDDMEGIEALAEAYIATGDYARANSHLCVLRSVQPSEPRFASFMGQALMGSGAFEAGIECHLEAIRLAQDESVEIRVGYYCAAGMNLSSLPSGFEGFRETVVSGLAATLREEEPLEFDMPPFDADRKTITVAYIVGADFTPEECAAAVRIFAAHDRSKVRVVGIGMGKIDASRNKPFKTNCDWWINAQNIDHFTLTTILRGESVDVLVDLSGLGCVEGVMLQYLRCAPLQISAPLGATGLSGVSGVDLSMEDLLSKDAGHALGALLHTFEPAPARTPSGASSLTYGADLDLRDLNWQVIGLWSRILKAQEGATLLLSGEAFENGLVVEKLIEAFGAFGVVDRIDVLSSENSERFLDEIDVLLTPFPNARASAVAAALSSGVPVVVMDGQSATPQVVRALGMADTMIAVSSDDYAAKALAAAAGGAMPPAKVDDVRNHSLFNAKKRISEIEDFYIASLKAE